MPSRAKNSNISVAKLTLILLSLCAAFSITNAQQTEEAMKTRISELTDKIAAAPNNDDLYAERGNLYLDLGKTSEASADAEKALQINAQNGDATMLRGRLRYGRKDYDGAIADYSLILKANPGKYPFVYFQRSEMYEQKGDYEKALADLSKTLELEPRAAVMVGKARARIGAKTKDTQKFSAGNPTVKKAAEPETELEKVMREEGITISKQERAKIAKESGQMTQDILQNSENTAKTVDALNNVKPRSAAENKMYELVFREYDVRNKFRVFKADYAKTSDAKQQLALLDSIKTEHQTALTELENVEKQNLNISSEDKNLLVEIKTGYSKSLSLINGVIAGKQSTTAAATGSTSKSNNNPPQITMDAINRQAADMTPEMRELANRAANRQLKPEDYRMVQLEFIEQDVKNKNAAFREAYTVASDAKQQDALLNQMRADYQKAIADTDRAEKQNAGFSAEEKSRIATNKKRYARTIEIINGIIADNKAKAAPGYKPANEYDLTVEGVDQMAFLMAPSFINLTTMYSAKDTNQKLKQQIQEMQTELKTATDPKRRRQLLESGKAAAQKALTEARRDQANADMTEQNKQILGTMISNYEALINRLDEVLSKTPQ